MASSINKVILLGRVGQKPEVKTSKNGKPYCRVSIATSEKVGDSESTTWHDVMLFGQTADFAGKALDKGNLVFVEGKIHKDSWTANDGTKRVSVSIYGNSIELLDSRGAAVKEAMVASSSPSFQGAGYGAQTPPSAPSPVGGADDDPGDDLPF